MSDLNERGENLKHRLKTSFQKGRDQVLGDLGSSDAQGRLGMRVLADNMLAAWNKYVSGQRYAGNPIEGNVDDVRNFLTRAVGKETVNDIEPTLLKFGATPPQTTTPSAPPPVPNFLKTQKNNIPNPTTATPPSNLNIPPVPSTPPAAPVATATPAAPQARTFGQKGRTPYDAPQVDQPVNTAAFGRKGTTAAPYVPPADLNKNSSEPRSFGVKGRNTPQPSDAVNPGGFGRKGTNAAPYVPPADLNNQANRDNVVVPKQAPPEERQKMMSTIVDRLSQTKQGTPERKAIVDRINKLRSNPAMVARFPELKQMTANESYAGPLVERALNRNELDQIFLAVAAAEASSGRNFANGMAPQQSQGQGQISNTQRQASAFRGSTRFPDVNSLLSHNVTLAGLEAAIKNAPTIKNIPVLQTSDYQKIKNALSKNGDMPIMTLLSKVHIHQSALATLLFAVERS